MRRRGTWRERVEARIAERRDDAFLAREFRDLGGEDQALRALRGLVRDGHLVRLGYGVHGRAEKSRLAPAVKIKGRFQRRLRYLDTELRLDRR